ncbi:uncharacterized protein LOC143291772 [Babylonia areolata]|uniref:uncharacterized protein LOC143291772 n=1 Tax=Babylonia areolata TaxID=304850 RepID=UPI003FD668F0
MGATSLLCCLALMAACVFQGHWCGKTCNAGIEFTGGRKMFEISPDNNVLIEFSVRCDHPLIEAVDVTGKTPKLLCQWVCPSSSGNCVCTRDGYILKISADEQTPSSQTFQIRVDGGQRENVTIILDSAAHGTKDNKDNNKDNNSSVGGTANNDNTDGNLVTATALSSVASIVVLIAAVVVAVVVVSRWKRNQEEKAQPVAAVSTATQPRVEAEGQRERGGTATRGGAAVAEEDDFGYSTVQDTYRRGLAPGIPLSARAHQSRAAGTAADGRQRRGREGEGRGATGGAGVAVDDEGYSTVRFSKMAPGIPSSARTTAPHHPYAVVTTIPGSSEPVMEEDMYVPVEVIQERKRQNH